MGTSQQIAMLFNKFSRGDNYTGVSLEQALASVSWQKSIIEYQSCNCIATLVFHIQYYISAVRQVLEGGELKAKDAESFTYPPISSDKEWQQLKTSLFNDIEAISSVLITLNSTQLETPFNNGKYGSTLRNVIGLLEHSHYHLGQIMLLKKLL